MFRNLHAINPLTQKKTICGNFSKYNTIIEYIAWEILSQVN